MRECQVFMIYGFLESGKTQFINFTTAQDYFKMDGKTLIIACEEGIEEWRARCMVTAPCPAAVLLF